MTRGVVFFDVDGTLVHGTSSGQHLADQLGHADALREAEAAIEATVDWCRDHELVPVLATLAWDVVGEHLCRRFGFVQACGPSLEVVDGRYTGRVTTHFDEWHKRDFARTTATDLGFAPTHCAAVGDSRSDMPLFAEVGFSIAFNATPELRAAAQATADGPDLQAVVPHLAQWLASNR